jgi:biopolymer transport protein ExbD
MKKKVLLSLVSFFMVTTMWASLTKNYYAYLTAAANGKTNTTCELTLNLKQQNAINTWDCTVALPEGFTFVQGSQALKDARFPVGAEIVFTATPSNDNQVKFHCECPDGFGITNTDGPIATFQVAIDATVTPGDYELTVLKGSTFQEVDTEVLPHQDQLDRVFTWTVEQGPEPGIPGDANEDGACDISDVVTVLDAMAKSYTPADHPAIDVNKDGSIDISDVVTVLSCMANQ